VATYEIRGDKIAKAMLKKIENLPLFLDPVYQKAARWSLRALMLATPVLEGGTRRAWQTPVKLGLSRYSIKNQTTTFDKKHSIIEILDKGRGVVYPKKAKRLYIPLSPAGRSKTPGARIPEGLVYGKDFVLAKKSRATKGLLFLDKIKKETVSLINSETTKLLLKN
jgi:hypothetical protein